MRLVMSHTPGPWVVVPEQSSHGCALCISAKGATIAFSPESPEYQHPEQAIDEANFAHIVKCVNAHDALTQAIRNFIGFAEYHELEKANPRLQLQLLEMRAALAKAGA